MNARFHFKQGGNMFTSTVKRGQALIIIVFAFIGLIAIVALAIDGGNVFLNRRSAQNAADNAALAGALAKTQGQIQSLTDPQILTALTNAAISSAASNKFSNDASNTVTVKDPPVAGLVGGCNVSGLQSLDPNDPEDTPANYIQVVIHTTVNTYFAPIVGIRTLSNCVEAIAHVKPGSIIPLAYGNAIAAMNCTGSDTLSSSNAANRVTLIDGGAFSNSSDAEAMYILKPEALSAPSVSAVGGIDAPGYLPTPTTGLQQFPCPLPDYYIPKYDCEHNYGDFPPSQTDTNVTISGTGSNKMATFIHGGVYCISGSFPKTGLKNDNSTGVTFVMLNQGISWTGNANINLTSPPVGTGLPTGGLLFFLPYSNSSELKWSGTSGMNIVGSVFAPASNIVLQGDFGLTAMQSQWIGATVNMTGNLTATFQYNVDATYHFTSPVDIELSK